MKIRINPCALITSLVLTFLAFHPFPASALMYDYTYTGTPFTALYPDPYSSNDFLTIEIKSPTPLLFSSSDQINTTGLSLTMSTGNLTMQLTDTILTPTAQLYFYSSLNNRTPDSWMVSMSELNQSMTSQNPLNECSDAFMVGAPRAGAYVMGQSFDPGVWNLTIIDQNSAPVPEPSTVFMLAAGLACITGFSYVKRKKKHGQIVIKDSEGTKNSGK